MSHSPFPIFVINLKRSPERKANMDKQLDALGLEHQYIDAVDGRQFTPHEVVERYGEQVFYTNSYNEQRMSLGALGCLLSHIKFYDLMIEDNIPAACVLEDDCGLSPQLPEVLNSKTLQEVSWGTLLLGHYSMFNKSFNKGAEAVYWRKKVCRGHYIARSAEFPYTTLGYLVKLETAKKLRDLVFPIRMPVDWVTGNTELVGDTLRIITPPCIVTNKEYRMKSTVRDGTDDTVPVELQREPPSLSLRRHLTLGLAYIVLGTKEQRSQILLDEDKNPSTYNPVEWQLKQDNTANSSYLQSLLKRKSYNPFEPYTHIESKLKRKIYKVTKRWKKHQSRRMRILLDIIKSRIELQKLLWHRVGRSASIRQFLYLSLRFVLNIPVAIFLVLIYFIQDVNRSIYYGSIFSAIRIYVKKIGWFRYTRVI